MMVWRSSKVALDSIGDHEYGLSSSVELLELVPSPGLFLGVMILEIKDGSICVFAFLDVSLVSLVDVVMEGVFKGDGEVLLSALDLDDECPNNGSEVAPGVWDGSGGVEESGSDDVGFEVLFDSAFFEFPPYDFKIGIGIISNLDLMESVVGPVVTLGDVSIVEVVMDVVVVTEVVGRIYPVT